jgi:hypothetical protein
MIIIYSASVKYSHSLKAKYQERASNGRFAKPKPTVKQVEKNPLATFFYPMSDQPWNSMKRTVRVIAATALHITGLEQQDSGRWKYKKFLQSKATHFQVVSFNPKSMS